VESGADDVELPSKLIEILEDPKMYKAGVAIKGGPRPHHL
jgi:hypothetical protein